MRLLITLLILACQPVYGQQKSIYVSTEGGGRSLFTLGRIAYNDFYFKSTESGRDTLVCSGKGLELCRLNAPIRQVNPELDELYRAYNKAISKSKRQIKRAEDERGNFSLLINNQEFDVSYRRNEKGKQMDFLILPRN